MNNSLIPQKEIQELKKQVPNYLQAAKVLQVKTKENFEKANEGLVKIRTFSKQVKGKLDLIVKPIKLGVKEVEGMFKPMLETLKEADDILQDKIAKYHTEQLAKVEVKKEEVIAKVESGEISDEKAGQKIQALENKVENKVFNEGGAVSFYTYRDIEIFDEKLLPREYLIPDRVLIRKDALAGKEIAGVKVIEEKRTKVNTK